MLAEAKREAERVVKEARDAAGAADLRRGGHQAGRARRRRDHRGRPRPASARSASAPRTTPTRSSTRSRSTSEVPRRRAARPRPARRPRRRAAAGRARTAAVVVSRRGVSRHRHVRRRSRRKCLRLPPSEYAAISAASRGGAKWASGGFRTRSWGRCRGRRWSRAIEAIEAGDAGEAKRLCEEMKHESQFMHDLLVDGIAGLISFVEDRLGDDGVEEAWAYSLERSWRSPVETIDSMDRREVARRRWRRPGGPTRPAASALCPGRSRSARTPRSSTFTMNPCGSGQRLWRIAATARGAGGLPGRPTTGATGGRTSPSTAPTARS